MSIPTKKKAPPERILFSSYPKPLSATELCFHLTAALFGFLSAHYPVQHDAEEQHNRGTCNQRSNGTDLIQKGIGLWLVDVPASHVLAARKMLWKEGKVHPDKKQPKVKFGGNFAVAPTRKFTEPEVDPGKQ